MKKIILIAMMFLTISFNANAGVFNKEIFDFNYSFEYASVRLPDGTAIYGKVQSWRDYEKDNQMQIAIDNVLYLVDKKNVILVHLSNDKAIDRLPFPASAKEKIKKQLEEN